MYGTIESLIDFFSFTAWIFYGGSMLALIVMRYTKPHAKRPYKVNTIYAIAKIFNVNFNSETHSSVRLQLWILLGYVVLTSPNKDEIRIGGSLGGFLVAMSVIFSFTTNQIIISFSGTNRNSLRCTSNIDLFGNWAYSG